MFTTILLTIISFTLCGYFLHWDIPFNIGFDPLYISGGYPNLINEYYENLLNKSVIAPNSLTRGSHRVQNKTLHWQCELLESANQCVSILYSSKCRNNSQFSFNYWSSSNMTKCIDMSTGLYTKCSSPSLNGNICENVIIRIQNLEFNSTLLYVGNITINSPVRQIFENQKKRKAQFSEKCHNYTRYEPVVFNNSLPVAQMCQNFAYLPFGINSTQLCQYQKAVTCNQNISYVLNLYGLSPNQTVCNCKTDFCGVNLIVEQHNGSLMECAIPSTMLLEFHETNGFISSAVIRFRNYTNMDNIMLSRVIVFRGSLSIRESSTTRYDKKRGRFHCPSETTCFSELLYPFSLVHSLNTPYQISILVISMLLSIVILRKNT